MLMVAATLDRDAFLPRAPAGLGGGLLLALVAHALLVTALSMGVNWRASPPEGIEAELWASVPQIAAPRAAEPESPPPPPPVKPVPTPEPVKPVAKEAPVPDAQIAIEKARRLEDKRKKESAEQAAADKLAKQRKAEVDKAKAEKLAEQKRKDEADKAKAKADGATKKQDATLAKAREAQMQRIASLAGATGDANATGTALQNAGPSASYIGRIKGRIRPNVSFPDTLPGNPKVEVDVRLAPDGRIMSSRIVKASGVPEWDNAVLRAIERTEVLPRDEYGKVPPEMVIEYQLRE